jgi:hypothetical protein
MDSTAKAKAKPPRRTRSARAPEERQRDEAPANSCGPGVVYTVGHSTRSLQDFIALLAAHGVQRLVDVRTVPRSRHNPQFNRETLPQALQPSGIDYVHMPGLGGLRKPRPDSVNSGWRNRSFRGYADHMQSAEFAASLDELMATARNDQLALMCAEAVPWRCHRSLIGDALLAHAVPVEEIVDAKRRTPHRLTPFAVIDGTKVTYPPADASPSHQAELFPSPQRNASEDGAE